MNDFSTASANDISASSGSEDKLIKPEQLMNESKSKQSLPLAIAGGFIGLIIATFLWSFVTYLTGYQVKFMAIGVGIVVGFAVRIAGRGRSFTFGLIGAFFSLLACFSGHLLSMITVSASVRGVSVLTVLSAIAGFIGFDEEMFLESITTTELLFYGIAVLTGFILSFYRVDRK